MKATFAVLLAASYGALNHQTSIKATISCPDSNTLRSYNCSYCNTSVLHCPYLEVKILKMASFIRVTCNDAFEELPNLKIGNISTHLLVVANCIPSKGESLMKTLRFLGVNNIKYLSYKNNDTIVPYTPVFLEGLQYLKHLTLEISFKQVTLDALKKLPHLKYLILNCLDSPNLQSGIFNNLVELSKLIILSTKTGELQPGIFRNQRKLETLFIKFQKLSGLNQTTFEGLENLEILDLSSNRIDSLPENTFGFLPNLTWLYLSMNRLPSIPGNLTMNRRLKIFALVSNMVVFSLSSHFLSHLPELQEVQLSNSNIYHLPETLFRQSRAITKAVLSRNRIRSAPELLLHDQSNLKYLDLGDNNLRRLPRQFFKANQKLEVLRLSNNKFKSFIRQVFASLKKLKELHLDNNKLHFIDYDVLQGITSLEILSLQHNILDGVPDWKNHSSTIQSNNSANAFSQFGKISLRQLDLSDNVIKHLSTYHFNFYSKTIRVDFTDNQISTIYMNHMDRDMSHVQVDLAGNLLNCDCHLLDFVQYVKPKNNSHINFVMDGVHCIRPHNLYNRAFDRIQNKDLTCSLPTKGSFKCPLECNCDIRPIDLTIIVNCSGQGLTKAQPLPQPSLINYTFIELYIENNFIKELPTLNVSNYEYVRELHARNNSIETLSVHNLPTHLHLVDLTYNKLTTMDKPILDTLISSVSFTSIYLSNNPWICDCTNQDFIRFVQQNRLKLSADKSPIICENGSTVDSIDLSKLCGENTGLVIVISLMLGLSGLLIGLLFAVFYFYQIEIKVWLFTHNLLLCLVTEEELDKDKEYDAFISYCHKDAQFIEDVLVPRMETEMNFKICLHERDWIPGEMIPDQIISSVEKSRRTIIVLSKHYLESTWAQMEFQAAYLKSQAEKRVRIIIIIFGEIGDVRSLGPELEAYLKMNTYVKYDDRWFWDKLRYAMPHPVAVAEMEMQTNRRSA